MIPCKDCLVLAACRNRTCVNCSELYKWLKAHKDGYSLRNVHIYFPSACRIFLVDPRRVVILHVDNTHYGTQLAEGFKVVNL